MLVIHFAGSAPPMKNIYKIKPDEIAAAVKTVRKFASGFSAADGFDLRKINAGHKITKYQKSKLNRYYQVIREGISRTHVILRSRNKKRLRQLQEASGHQDFPTNLRVAFYPTTLPVKPQFDKKGVLKSVKVGTLGIESWEILLDAENFVRDPDGEMQRILDLTPANFFEILVGENTMKRAYPRTDLSSSFQGIAGLYNYGSHDPDSWQHFLRGVRAYIIPDQNANRQWQRSRNAYRQCRENLATIKPRTPEQKKAKKLKFIQCVNALNIEMGLPMIDPEDYGL